MAHTAPRPATSLGLFRHTLVPLFLVTVCPPFAILLWYVHVHLDGSLLAIGDFVGEHGVLGALGEVFLPVMLGTPTAWAIIGVFAAFQLLLMRVLPGARFEGPPAPSGHVPVYKANGPLAFVVTLGTYAVCSWGLGLFSPTIVYDHFGPILGALNVFSLVFCGALYLKGRFAPSGPDHGVSGNPLFDYYWGTELYPRIAGWDVKMFTNCRFGMMGWPVILISFAAAQHAATGLTDAMVVAVGLQLVYIGKFFWWETGYLRSLDIMHDRAGFYICWGCLVWVPSVYTASTLYLVGTEHTLGWPLAVAVFVGGVAMIFVNYWADRQRQTVRATGGRCKVWGRDPVLIVGHYRTEEGEARQSLLLASGWWGVSRHFHYVPELLAAAAWTAPVGFSRALPWFYVLFLGILLTDRAFRDDARCARKYGKDWDAYCKAVPYKIIPGFL